LAYRPTTTCCGGDGRSIPTWRGSRRIGGRHDCETPTMMLALTHGAYSDACRPPYASHGLMRVRPQPAKPSVSRVTTAARATKAVAAISASNVWIGAPA
jgi:hypothetical protein